MLVQIYFGDGKGKTTAAIGLAIRALGHDFKVGIVFFMKNPSFFPMGENQTLALLQKNMPNNLQVFFYGKAGWVLQDQLEDIDRQEAIQGLQKCKDLINQCDLLIMDEILNAIHFNLISEDAVLDFIHNKPRDLEVVLTGRKASKRFIDKADLVTEVVEIKHPYHTRLEARKGIEY
ncbi:cob(I)yrinic acid a,c-diamide adenosyltransferase [Desulfuribacillus stibiiarsenatis]|nr:cob(I)yrinic acid a,c-diamide adenosyltransferase [Desulfuribacillus stibiiarsenatis]